MKWRKSLLLSVPLIVFGCLSVAPEPASADSDYCLEDLAGVEHCASELHGKWLIINFWASWCAPCLHEMPELEKFFLQNKSRAQVWGVTFESDNREEVVKFVEQLGVTYPILGFAQDPLTGYGTVSVLPTTFVIAPDGLFHQRFEGPITAQDLNQSIKQE